MNQTRLIHCCVLILMACGVALPLAAQEPAEGPKPPALVERDKPVKVLEGPDTEDVTQWDCTVYQVCVCYDPESGDEYECGLDEFGGQGSSESAACSNAKAACEADNRCDYGTPHCCYPATTNTSDPCYDYPPASIEEPGLVKQTNGKLVTKRYHNITFTEFLYPEAPKRYEFSGVGESSGRRVTLGSFTREDAWSRFLKLIGRDGGLRAGSLQFREVPRWIYKCYVRVQSRQGNTIYNQELQHSGTSKETAVVGAVDLARQLELYLVAREHTEIEILPSVRCVTLLNTQRNACTESVSCRFRCTTNEESMTIETARYGRDRNAACAAAETAAISLADDYGGISSGETLDAESPSGKRDCTDCGDSVSKPDTAKSMEF
ncbi:hypothetical protein [Planctomycetes bacterium TBK1r]|uniref:Uncharacterized protein n=1 Tax=Stieleria magnilauensis TaxID=2527963 RepID=A0ABX5Y6K7_9BACT|nr:hypothetical protein TBK1r_78600 [Planctomycetes bacterium TBK1r]